VKIGDVKLRDFLNWVSDEDEDIAFFVQLNSKVARCAADEDWWKEYRSSTGRTIK